MKKRRRKSIAPDNIAGPDATPTAMRADIVTPEFLAHHEVEPVTVTHFGDGRELRAHRTVTLRVRDKRLIDKYFVKKIISLDQHAAADRLHQDYVMGSRPSRVTANLMGVGGGGGPGEATVRQVAARKSFDAAMATIALRDRHTVLKVVLHDDPAGARVRGLVTPLDRLIRALHRLIKHYGIA